MPFCTLPAITVRPVMRVRPTISAEAVAAVLRGLRTAFCRARLPEMPNARSTGAARAISGRDSSGVRTNTPISSSTAPPPITALPSSMPVAVSTPAAPAPAKSAPMVLRTTSDLVVAVACTLFIAATGGIFAARRPGSQAARTVTTTPTSSEARIVDGETTSGPSGTVAPVPFIRVRSPAPMPIPAARPATAAIAPTTNASISTERVTWRRLAPTARISASSLVRWATSMVKVLAMMKMPTNSAIPAKASRPVFMPSMLLAICSAWSSASFLPVVASTPSRGSTLSTAAFRALWDVPGAAFTSISLYAPGAANSFCALAVSNSARLPPAATVPSSVVKMPVSFASRTGPSTEIRTVSPTL